MKNFISFSFQVLISLCLTFVVPTRAGGWTNGRATFYEDASGAACGYNAGQSYGDQIAAVSEALFNNGALCGACYEIMCVNSPNCNRGAGSIKVTATNFCPSTSGPNAWCNPPQKHFDLSIAMFTKLAPYKFGIVPVQFRRIRCARSGGVRFTISAKTNPNWLEVLVHNVAGDGVVRDVQIKGSRTGWIQMRRNWGQNWDVSSPPNGQTLSFNVRTTDGRSLLFNNVAPANWQSGQTFAGKQNFG
uniref:Expansin n=1 Tax=Kalanchoe fedtschenkoi TaxID=63787 RepID=A0A7N0SXW5_KALFE